MYDNVKPIILGLSPYNTILKVSTNDLKSEKTSRMVGWSIIDVFITLKVDKNIITISLTVPSGDNLNNKANEVNNSLKNICSGSKHFLLIIMKTSVQTFN